MEDIAEYGCKQKKCKVCGKRFYVLWPQQWAYKTPGPVNRKWFCSWKCIQKWREHEKKKGEEPIVERKKDIRRNQREVLADTIEAIKNGKKPTEYLGELGYWNPQEEWYKLRRWAKEKAPDLYEMIPETRTERKPREPKKAAQEIRLEPGVDYTLAPPTETQAEVVTVERVPEPVRNDDLEIAAVYSKVLQGTYRKTKDGMYLNGAGTEGGIVLNAYQWFRFSEEIIQALRQLDATPAQIGGGENG